MSNSAKELKQVEVTDADVQMIHEKELFKLVAKELEVTDPEDTEEILKKYQTYDKTFKG